MFGPSDPPPLEVMIDGGNAWFLVFCYHAGKGHAAKFSLTDLNKETPAEHLI